MKQMRKLKKLFFCVKKNYKEILLITGKGIHSNTDKDVYVSKDLSKLRYSVPEYIKSIRFIKICISQFLKQIK